MFSAYIPLKSLKDAKKSPSLNQQFPDLNTASSGTGLSSSGHVCMLQDFAYPREEWGSVQAKMVMYGAISKDWNDHEAHLVLSAPFYDDLPRRMQFAGMCVHIAQELGVTMFLFSSPETSLTFIASTVALSYPLLATSGIEVNSTPDGQYQIRLQGIGLLTGQDYATVVPSLDAFGAGVVFLEARVQEALASSKRYEDGDAITPNDGTAVRYATLFIDEKTAREVIVFA